MDLLKILERRKISTSSYIGAVQDLTVQHNYSPDQYRSLYNELTDSKCQFDDQEVVYQGRYLVQHLVRANVEGTPVEVSTLVRDADISAKAYLERLNDGDLKFLKTANTSSEEESETSKPKKGQKKKIAEQVYLDMWKTSTREEIIKALMEHSFTESGANSYYYVCSKKFGVPEKELGKPKRKRGGSRKNDGSPKKSDLAVEVYSSNYKTMPKGELVKTIAVQMNISERDAVGYYYVARRAVGAQSAELAPRKTKG